MTGPTNADESLLQYPCDFEVKAMGRNEPAFEDLVVTIVQRHLERGENVESRTSTSRKDNYQSVTVRFTATSRRQLDAIYMDLTDEPAVLVAL